MPGGSEYGFSKNDQSFNCQGDPYNILEDHFNSDSEEPYVIPDSQISGRSVCRMCLPFTRTRDAVYSPNILNKTFTISSVRCKFDDTTQGKMKVQAKMIDSKEETLAEKYDSVMENSTSQDPVSQTPNTSSKLKKRKKMKQSDSLDYSFLDDDVNDMSQIKKGTEELVICQHPWPTSTMLIKA